MVLGVMVILVGALVFSRTTSDDPTAMAFFAAAMSSIVGSIGIATSFAVADTGSLDPPSRTVSIAIPRRRFWVRTPTQRIVTVRHGDDEWTVTFDE